jgi:transcriptional regulator with XRE-family HTH domain
MYGVVFYFSNDIKYINPTRNNPKQDSTMISSAQMKAARALLGMDRKTLAELSGLSLPTIQRMESADGVVGGTVESLVKVVEALENAGVELIGEGTVSQGKGRGVRLKQPLGGGEGQG